MANGSEWWCSKCGSRLGGHQDFCPDCGTPRLQAPSMPAPCEAKSPAAYLTPSPLPTGPHPHPTPPSPGTRTGQAPAVASRAYGAVARAAGVAGIGLALPWQRVAGAGRPDIGAFLSAGALPGAQRAIRASLKRPGLALAATTVLDLAVAVITGGTNAFYKAIPRLVVGGSTSFLSLATGSKGGRLRRATGISGTVTAGVQLGFAVYTLIAGIGDGTSALVIAPQVVAIASSLVMAVKTMAVAFRRP
jgi:hypothetical protein